MKPIKWDYWELSQKAGKTSPWGTVLGKVAPSGGNRILSLRGHCCSEPRMFCSLLENVIVRRESQLLAFSQTVAGGKSEENSRT